jgi:signal transduction histidine kinase
MVNLEARIRSSQGKVEVGELPTVSGDPLQMQQLFQNLIGNALKFHREGVPPEVKVSSRPGSPGSVEICVEDNGTGFDVSMLEQIFHPFHRLHGRSEYEGSGIGLAICRKIAERHGGSITATSEVGKGSTFIVALPEGANPKEKILFK